MLQPIEGLYDPADCSAGASIGGRSHQSCVPSPFGLECDNWNSSQPMFVILWQFDIVEDQVPAFEAAYGAAGTWAELFGRSPEYLGTELLKDAYVPGRYVTIDRWRSEEAFRAFRAQHDPDYEAIDRGCDSFTAAETRIGAFIA